MIFLFHQLRCSTRSVYRISTIMFILNDETILMLKFLVCSSILNQQKSQQLLGSSENLEKDSVGLLGDRQCYEDN